MHGVRLEPNAGSRGRRWHLVGVVVGVDLIVVVHFELRLDGIVRFAFLLRGEAALRRLRRTGRGRLGGGSATRRDGGELIEVGKGKESPNALQASVPAGNGPARVARFFGHEGVADLRVEADVFVEKPSNTSGAFAIAVLTVVFGPSNGPTAEAQISPVPDGVNLVVRARDSAGAISGYMVSAPELAPYDTWFHLQFDVGLATSAAAPPVVRLKSDKTKELTATPVRETVQPLATQVYVGLLQREDEPIKGVAVRVDNVVATPL